MQEIRTAPQPDPGLTEIVKTAGSLSFDIVELAGLLDDTDQRAEAQLGSLAKIRDNVDRVANGNRAVESEILTVVDTANSMVDKVDHSLEKLRQNSSLISTVVNWVEGVAKRMQEVEDRLSDVQLNADKITEISLQVHLLAINAKIEAARAGEAGRGFSVVADAINDLSEETAAASTGIADSITTLSSWVTDLREDSEKTSGKAQQVSESSSEMSIALEDISTSTNTTRNSVSLIEDQFGKVTEMFADFTPQFADLHGQNTRIVDHVHQIRNKTHGLVDRSETILQLGVGQGGGSSDQNFIQSVQRDALRIGSLFEEAIERGHISRTALFSRQYTPIPGTNPEQVMAPFTNLTDRVLPSIQEAALSLDDRVVFCAAVNRDGYLPTHNRKFSHPQGSDPVRNASHSRNRRIFDDRVGLKAGQNTAPFLLQVYRRDMGGGQFRMMKDLSAPIIVNGQHWGGLRLAYGFD